MSDHDEKSTPIPDDPTISMDETFSTFFEDLRVNMLRPGFVPTPDDVAAVIAERGRWGDPPRYVKCEQCSFPVFSTEMFCAACNAPRPDGE